MANFEVGLLHNYLTVGALLFGIGMIGFVSRRNMIVMFLSAEMMLQGVSLSLVAWGRFHNNFDGQILVLFIITVAACEAAIALGLILMLFRRSGSLDVAVWQHIREADLPPQIDQRIPDDPEPPAAEWPELAVAGRRPKLAHEETDHRRQV
jgi:NADH-quinone oxidoreductase subunit K